MPAVRPAADSCVPYSDETKQRTQLRHWGARIVCLIVLPILVYMVSFKIHFLILNHSGPGDAQMSSLFQANLQGNDFAQNPLGEWAVSAGLFLYISHGVQRSRSAQK